MKPDEHQAVEDLLASVPTVQLSARTRRSIAVAIRSARPGGSRWWRRRIPVWQAAAACLLAAMCSALLSRGGVERRGEEAVTVTAASAGGSHSHGGVAGPIEMGGLREWMGVASRDAYQMDVRRWRVLQAGHVEDKTD